MYRKVFFVLVELAVEFVGHTARVPVFFGSSSLDWSSRISVFRRSCFILRHLVYYLVKVVTNILRHSVYKSIVVCSYKEKRGA